MHAATFALALAAGAELALAVPSHGHHAHLHHARSDAPADKRDAQNWNDAANYAGVNWNDASNYAGVNWATVNYGGSSAAAAAPTSAPAPAAAPAKAPAPAAAPAAAPAPAAPAPAAPVANAVSNAVNNVNNAVNNALGGISSGSSFGSATSQKINSNVFEYVGNVGSPFGSNILLITENQASGFQYVNNFTSTCNSARTWVVWNKSGPDGQPNSGQYLAPVHTFTIPAGGYQLVAFAPNSQTIACDYTLGETNPSMGGSRKCAYIEMDFGNESNGGWSGYDVSNIQNVGGQCNVQITSANGGALSSCTQNSYNSGNADQGGIGGNLAPGNVHLTTSFGS